MLAIEIERSHRVQRLRFALADFFVEMDIILIQLPALVKNKNIYKRILVKITFHVVNKTHVCFESSQ